MVLTQPERLPISFPLEAIAHVCEKNGVSQLAVFGSILREDFDPMRSDVDFLVRFLNNDAGPWMSKIQEMATELASILGRKVDVIDWGGVEQSINHYRRNHILQHARVVYVS
jgi:uncharacterized protein